MLHDRIGTPICAGLPWMRPEDHEAPRGMLERPETCLFARNCAVDRCCWQGRAMESAAWARYRLAYDYERRTGRTEAQSFEEWIGRVKTTARPLAA